MQTLRPADDPQGHQFSSAEPRPGEIPGRVESVSAGGRSGTPQWFAMAGVATVGMTGVRISGWTLSDFLFLIAGVLIVVRLLEDRKGSVAPLIARHTSPALLVGLGVFTAGALTATVFRSIDPAGSALVVVRIWYITLIWFWMLRSVTNSIQVVKRLLLAAVVGALAHGLVGIFQDVTGANNVEPYWGRSQGFADHFGDLGISIACVIPLLAVWQRDEVAGRKRDLRIVALLVALAGVGSSGSMTPLGAAIIGTAVALLARKLVGASRVTRRRIALPLLAGMIVAAGITTGTVELPVQVRFTELTTNHQDTTGSAESREHMTRVAIDGIVESPFVGVGLDQKSGMAANTYNHDLSIHSFYLRVAFEAGLLALAGILFILFVIYRQCWQLLRFTRNSTLSWIPAGLLGALVTSSISAMFGPILFGRFSWLPMALVSAVYGAARAGLMKPYLTNRATSVPAH